MDIPPANSLKSGVSRITSLVVVLFVAFVTSAQQPYFPRGSLGAYTDSFKAEWYSTQLRALNEPSLLQLSQDKTRESYRFVWLRSFHHPVAVRVDVRPDGIGELTLKVGSGAGGYKPGETVQNLSRPLTLEESSMFLARLQKLDFWSLPSYKNEERDGDDGAQWIIEGAKDGKYHVVDRWSPREGPVRELGITLALGLADLKIPKRDLY